MTENTTEIHAWAHAAAARSGELLVSEGLVRTEDLEYALEIQRKEAQEASGAPAGEEEHIVGTPKAHRTIGEILCDLNLITPEDLGHVLQKYNKQKRLGGILLSQNLIDEDHLNDALDGQRLTVGSLGRMLVEKEILSPDQLYGALSRQYHIPYKPLDGFIYSEPQKKVLSSIVGQNFADSNLILPLSLEGNTLTVALYDPRKLGAILELGAVYAYLRVHCVLIQEETFCDLFLALYGRRLPGERPCPQKQGPVDKTDSMKALYSKAPSVVENPKAALGGVPVKGAYETVNWILRYGVMRGASDIHIEQDCKGGRLRYRVQGVLQTVKPAWLAEQSRDATEAVISKIKEMAGLDVEERQIPQSGVFKVGYRDKKENRKFHINFSVATCPGVAGENLTVAITDSREARGGLDDLGCSGYVLDAFKDLLGCSAGVILAAGPAGSGKFSLLYGALTHIAHPGIKIITAEDPVKSSVPGVLQAQVSPKLNLTHAELLRSFLDQDPDVVLVDDIRDQETARRGFDLAQAGCLLLGAINSRDAVGSISRLRALNVEAGLLASHLKGVLAQRRLKKICDGCREEYMPSEDQWRALFGQYPSHLMFYRGRGCDSCGFTGYRGHTIISEILLVDPDISQALDVGADEEQIRKLALRNGMRTMMEDALMKLNQITLSEIIRTVPREGIKSFKPRTAVEESLSGHSLEEKTPAVSTVRHESFVISDPRTERMLLDKMYETYQTLKKKAGRPLNGSEAFLFGEFIAESYHKICTQFQCDCVTFSLEPQEDRVEIFASPGR